MGNRFSTENLRKKYSPMIENWEFVCGKGKDEEAKKELTAYVKDLYAGEEDHLDISSPDAIALRGNVYGRKGAQDGEIVTTSYLVSIDRVDWKPTNAQLTNGEYSLEEIASCLHEEIFCATTHTGSKYYFRGSTIGSEMFVKLGRVYAELH